ncbi:MAG: hypothetical protein AAF266_09645 [Planctomycetota bacterium]
MLGTSILSLVLLSLSGLLLDSHRRDWRDARENDLATAAYRFARSRFLRRCVATCSIAIVGVLIALWPVTPRLPFWVLGYAAALASLAALIFTLGVGDAWASARFHRAETQEQLFEHRARLAEALEEQRARQESAPDGEAART